MKIITANIFAFANKPKIIALLFWVSICTALISYSVVKKYILPNYFFFDESTLSQYMQWGAQFKVGDSYASTAAFFNLFGADKDSLPFTIISTLMIIAQYIYCLKKSNIKSFTLVEISLFVFLAFLSVTYMSMLSKDSIVALLLVPFMFLARYGLFGIIVWCALALLYAAYFRAYWFIMIPMFLGMYWIFRVANKPIFLILATPIALLSLSLAFSAFLGLDLDNFRTSVNDVRIDAGDNNARTMILPWIAGGGPIISWLNSCITWVTLMFPIPLFLLLSPYYLLIAGLISVLFYKSWGSFFKILVNKSKPDLAACSALIISFTAIQSIFEPDYGSYVRHLAPLYPIIFYVIFKSQRLTNSRASLKSRNKQNFEIAR